MFHDSYLTRQHPAGCIFNSNKRKVIRISIIKTIKMAEAMAMTAAQDIIYPTITVHPANEPDNHTATSLIYSPFYPWTSPMPSVGQFAFGISEDSDGRLSQQWGSVMGLGIALDRVVLVEPNEKEAFMDGPIPRLTRSQLIRHCKTHNNAVPESDLEIWVPGLWGLGAWSGIRCVWEGKGGGRLDESVGLYGEPAFSYAGCLVLSVWNRLSVLN